MALLIRGMTLCRLFLPSPPKSPNAEGNRMFKALLSIGELGEQFIPPFSNALISLIKNGMRLYHNSYFSVSRRNHG
jgi:hypothetical protein